MRCHICDRVLEEPRYNADHEDYEPCESCMAVINDTLDGYKDNSIVAEDELSDDILSLAEEYKEIGHEYEPEE